MGIGTGVEVGLGVGVGNGVGTGVEVGLGVGEPMAAYPTSGVKVGRTGGMYCGVFVGNCFGNVAEGVEKLTLGLRFTNARSKRVGVGSIGPEHPNAMLANMTDTTIKANFNTYSESLFRYIKQKSNFQYEILSLTMHHRCAV